MSSAGGPEAYRAPPQQLNVAVNFIQSYFIHLSGSKSPQSSFEIGLVAVVGRAGWEGASILPIESGDACKGGSDTGNAG